MTDRSPESFTHEVDYWRAVIAELEDLNTALLAITPPIVAIPFAMLDLVSTGDLETAVKVVGAHGTEALLRLNAAQAPVGRMIDLVSGRQLALQAELDRGQQ
jgi:hypothetical protein